MTKTTVCAAKWLRNAALAATAIVGITGAASADEYHTARTWYEGGGFTVEQVVDDTTGEQWCAMKRGQPGEAMFFLNAMRDTLLITLMDNVTWHAGQVRLWVDGRYWTAQATVRPDYPNQLNVSVSRSQTTVNFLVALAAGQTLTFESGGSQVASGFRYNVPLSGSMGAMTATMDCHTAVYGRSAPVRPTGPAVTAKNVM